MDIEADFEKQIVGRYDEFVRRLYRPDALVLMEIVKPFLLAGIDLNTPKYTIPKYTTEMRSAAEIIYDMLSCCDMKSDQGWFLREIFEKYKVKVTYRMLTKTPCWDQNLFRIFIDSGGDVNATPTGVKTLLEHNIYWGWDVNAFENLLLAGADMQALTLKGDKTIEEYLYFAHHRATFIEIYEQFCGGKSLKAAKSTE